LSERYYGLSAYFQKTYGEKLVKLSLDGGFTCPNRDGTLSHKGCVFCSEQGSGEFTGLIIEGKKQDSDSIVKQIASQKCLMSQKWQSKAYIAYFQNYTNTYKPIDELKRLYEAALEDEEVKGIAISTRPDCVTEQHIALFKSSRVLWVELGLQTIHDQKSGWLNRHYDYPMFLKTFEMLKQSDIPVVVHLIAGLPGESKLDFIETVSEISKLLPFGIKFHMLNVIKNTELANIYQLQGFNLLTEETYIEWICDAIEVLHPSIVIHRVTGDAEKASLIEPKWILNKRSVLNGINKCLVARNSKQGIKCNPSA